MTKGLTITPRVRNENVTARDQSIKNMSVQDCKAENLDFIYLNLIKNACGQSTHTAHTLLGLTLVIQVAQLSQRD